MRMMKEIPISSQGPKGGNAHFLEDAERNAAYSGMFKLGCFLFIDPGSGGIWKFERCPDNPRGKWVEQRVTDVYLCKSMQS